MLIQNNKFLQNINCMHHSVLYMHYSMFFCIYYICFNHIFIFIVAVGGMNLI
jgi:hypothetical protein